MTRITEQLQKSKAVDFKLLNISSTAFGENTAIPDLYTCKGKDINPPLDIADIPEEAKSLAIIVEDPDAPKGVFTHWVTWDIPVTHHLKEAEAHGTQGMNDFGKHRYNGPCPPSGTHRYFFKVYALDSILNLPVSTDKTDLEKAMGGHILAFGELVGLYSKNK